MRVKAKGFTAIELLVVIAIAAVLATLAMPDFRTTIDRWRVKQASEALQSTLFAARSEAVKHGGGITVQRNPSGLNDCTYALGAGDWSCGWSVKVGSTLLRHIPSPSGTIVQMKSGSTDISLDRYGYFSVNQLQFKIKARGNRADASSSSVLCVEPGGKMMVIRGSETCP